MRRAAKADANQPEITAALRAAGWSVKPIHTIGQGVPDLLIAREVSRQQRVTALVECKMPGEKLTPDEATFHRHWQGVVLIAMSGQDAVNKAQDVLRGVGP